MRLADSLPQRRWPLLSACLTAGFCLLFVSAKAQAQYDTSLSPPLSGSLGDPVYSESDLSGPSSTLVQGDNNLLTPYLRNGISDPLGFLIESGPLSPYFVPSVLIDSLVESYVPDLVLNDSTVAARFGEYRDNRVLMSGAGAKSTPGGRAAAAGGTQSGSYGTRAAVSGSSAFSGVSHLAPFAAGSSALATAESGLSGASAGFVDPNALVAMATSSAYLGSGTQTDMSATDLSATTASSVSSSQGQFSTTAGLSFADLAEVPMSVLVPAPDSTAIGPGPGGVFPDVTMVTPAASGFPDSTMGTAGSSYQTMTPGDSPLLAPMATDPNESPFAPVSGQDTRYLSPSLVGGGDDTSEARPVSLDELRRKARMHAMIYSPTSPLPTPFEARAIEREYLRKKSSRRRASHYASMTSTTATKQGKYN